jgi:SAM-dependent methyltransferase
MTSPKPFVFDETGEAKRHAPATERNRDAIAGVLAGILPDAGTVLEIASGTGEHLIYFAARFPALVWQPSDYDEAGLASIASWSAEAALPNILPPVHIDASAADWPIAHADAILCINMIHIAPWSATQGLMTGAARTLGPAGVLYLYGPYLEVDVPTAPSNLEFDASLKSRNAGWGLRRLDDVIALAAEHGLHFERRIPMPANNLSLVFRRV